MTYNLDEPLHYRTNAGACHNGLPKNTVARTPHASGMHAIATVKDKISAVGYSQTARKPSP